MAELRRINGSDEIQPRSKFTTKINASKTLIAAINYFRLLYSSIYPWTGLKRTNNQNFRLVDRPAREMDAPFTVWTLLLLQFFLQPFYFSVF